MQRIPSPRFNPNRWGRGIGLNAFPYSYPYPCYYDATIQEWNCADAGSGYTTGQDFGLTGSGTIVLPSGKIIYCLEIVEAGLSFNALKDITWQGYDSSGNSQGTIVQKSGTTSPPITNAFISTIDNQAHIQYDSSGTTYDTVFNHTTFDGSALENLDSTTVVDNDATKTSDLANVAHAESVADSNLFASLFGSIKTAIIVVVAITGVVGAIIIYKKIKTS